MKWIRILIWLLLIGSAGAASLEAADSEFGTTPIIAVVPDFDHMQKWDAIKGGDTADPFWADDDNLYHFTCDGWGFGSKNRNISFNKLTGPDLLHLKGSPVNSMDEYGTGGETGPDGATWKATGQECIDGIFYVFVERNIYGHKSNDPLMRQTSFNASLIKSSDRGLTWSRSAQENYDTPMWPGSRFGAPAFIHYGHNGGQVRQDNADQFVYVISNNGFWNGGDDFILGRIRRADLPKLNAADWRYYTGGDGLAESSWTEHLAEAKPILNLPAKLGWTAPAFIPALNRYLLVSWYVTPTLKKWFDPGLVTYDFYEAGHPWGPWTFVSSFNDHFLAVGHHMYGPNLCAKYQERIGEDVKIILFTSGCPFEYQGQPESLYKMWCIPLILKTTPLPPVTLVNDGDPAIRYLGDWQSGTNSPFNDTDDRDNFHFNHTRGDTVEYTFTGTGIELLSEKYHIQGSLDVFLDDQPRGQVNLNFQAGDFPRLSKVRVFSAQGLSPGKHTIRIVNSGSGYVTFDAFRVTDGVNR